MKRTEGIDLAVGKTLVTEFLNFTRRSASSSLQLLLPPSCWSLHHTSPRLAIALTTHPTIRQNTSNRPSKLGIAMTHATRHSLRAWYRLWNFSQSSSRLRMCTVRLQVSLLEREFEDEHLRAAVTVRNPCGNRWGSVMFDFMLFCIFLLPFRVPCLIQSSPSSRGSTDAKPFSPTNNNNTTLNFPFDFRTFVSLISFYCHRHSR